MAAPYDPTTPLAGRRFGSHVVLRVLGVGGMGVVYEAEHVVLRRRAALKVLPDSLRRDPDAARRFLREARAAARLNHPNCVCVHEVGEQDGAYYIVMELVRGGSAADFLKVKGPFQWRDAARVIADACRGLHAAHEAGLIHRDLKPANIMRSRSDGLVKIADFGLVKFAPGGEDSSGSSSTAGQVVGTPQYMSPEQCHADPLDARSDIYAMGATLFSLLTAKVPYPDRKTPTRIMHAHCFGPVPDPREHVAGLPASLVTVLMRSMAKKAADRQQTALEFAAELDTCLAEGGLLTDAATSGRRPAIAGTGSGRSGGQAAGQVPASVPVHVPAAVPGVAAPPSGVPAGSAPGNGTGAGDSAGVVAGGVVAGGVAGSGSGGIGPAGTPVHGWWDHLRATAPIGDSHGAPRLPGDPVDGRPAGEGPAPAPDRRGASPIAPAGQAATKWAPLQFAPPVPAGARPGRRNGVTPGAKSVTGTTGHYETPGTDARLPDSFSNADGGDTGRPAGGGNTPARVRASGPSPAWGGGTGSAPAASAKSAATAAVAGRASPTGAVPVGSPAPGMPATGARSSGSVPVLPVASAAASGSHAGRRPGSTGARPFVVAGADGIGGPTGEGDARSASWNTVGEPGGGTGGGLLRTAAAFAAGALSVGITGWLLLDRPEDRPVTRDPTKNPAPGGQLPDDPKPGGKPGTGKTPGGRPAKDSPASPAKDRPDPAGDPDAGVRFLPALRPGETAVPVDKLPEHVDRTVVLEFRVRSVGESPSGVTWFLGPGETADQDSAFLVAVGPAGRDSLRDEGLDTFARFKARHLGRRVRVRTRVIVQEGLPMLLVDAAGQVELLTPAP